MMKQITLPKQTTQSKYERERSPSPEPIYKNNYENQNYEVPSKETYFFARCDQPMDEICEETNYFQQIPDDIKIPMLKFICDQSYQDGPSVYGEYDAPPDRETVEAINGKGGYFLKKTTEAADIYLIWYNRQKNIYKFWGPTQQAVKDAMNRIRGRIVKYVIHLSPTSHLYRQDTSHSHSHSHSHHSRKHNDLASSPPPCDYTTPAEKEAKYNPPQIMRSESMAVAAGYDYSLEKEATEPLGLCRSMSMM